jgi:predicted nucleotide-binding protein
MASSVGSVSVTSPVERRWEVRQVVLNWLFDQALHGRRMPVLSAESITAAVDWAGQQLTTDEVNQASGWLKDQGLIEGQGVWGGGIPRPRLTSLGEAAAESKRSLREQFSIDASGDPRPEASTGDAVPSAIFLVHGRDSAAKFEVARWLEQRVGADVVILDEQAHRGRTIIEKFQDYADAAKFAVVLLTKDDVGGAQGQAQHPRARQNVIFEMGYFFGKLGRDRVAVLNDGVEQPSDFVGLGYISYSGNWKDELAKELTAAGFAVTAG